MLEGNVFGWPKMNNKICNLKSTSNRESCQAYGRVSMEILSKHVSTFIPNLCCELPRLLWSANGAEGGLAGKHTSGGNADKSAFTEPRKWKVEMDSIRAQAWRLSIYHTNWYGSIMPRQGTSSIRKEWFRKLKVNWSTFVG